MKGTIKVNHLEQNIYISSAFARAAMSINSEEYKTLQSIKLAHPDYKLCKREIKKNPHKECYRGLTYAYMDDYINTHDESGQIKQAYAELRKRTECHSIRYAHIKKWFLQVFPEIDDFTPQQYLGESSTTDNTDRFEVIVAAPLPMYDAKLATSN